MPYVHSLSLFFRFASLRRYKTSTETVKTMLMELVSRQLVKAVGVGGREAGKVINQAVNEADSNFVSVLEIFLVTVSL